VTATTGRAAIGVGGTTIDSLMAFDRSTGHVWKKEVLDYNMQSCRRIILVDEASMISTVMAMTISRIASDYGKHIVLVGDWAQASPVVTNQREMIQHNPDMDPVWPFRTELFEDCRIIRLEKCHRQQDAHFLNQLNKIRSGCVDDEADSLFRGRYVPEHPFFDRACLRIYATNREAEVYNRQRLREVCRENGSVPLKCEVEFTGHRRRPFTENQVSKIIRDSPLCDSHLAEGARVVFTRNELPASDRRYVNGDTGWIDSIRCDNRGTPEAITVLMDRDDAIIEVEPIDISVENATGVEIYTITGFPLRLGWALTIHKTQGMTADYIWFDMGSLRSVRNAGGREALHGLTYVALSRCRKIDNLYITGWDPTLVYCDPKVTEFL